MGPYDGPNETFSGEYPTSRYIVGRLAPIDQRISEEEDDTLRTGEDDDEVGETDDPLPLVLGFHPRRWGSPSYWMSLAPILMCMSLGGITGASAGIGQMML
jgi:hypothetical protein